MRKKEQEQEGADSLALGNPAMRMAMINRSECVGGGSGGWSGFIYINDIYPCGPSPRKHKEREHAGVPVQEARALSAGGKDQDKVIGPCLDDQMTLKLSKRCVEGSLG